MKHNLLKYTTTLMAVMSPSFLWAQSEIHPSQIKSVLTEPVALFMSILALLLLCVIIVLCKGIIIGTDIYKKNKINKNSLLLVIALLTTPMLAHAQEEVAAVSNFSKTIGGIEASIFYLLSGIIIFEIVLILILLRIFYTLLGKRKTEEQQAKEAQKKAIHWIERFNNAPAAKGITDEELSMGHDFDGIEELDNPTPPWWRWGFVISVVFAFVYLWIYELSGTGKDQYQELAVHTQEAEEAVKAYLAKSANNVNEHSVVYLNNESDLAAGKAIFVQMCAACHATDGGGNEVGPNLADEYWIHGGGIKDIFKTIKYGITEKGMKSWQDDYSPGQIAQLASYVKSLKGSTPAQPKEPQGELFTDSEEATPSETESAPESAATTTDALPKEA